MRRSCRPGRGAPALLRPPTRARTAGMPALRGSLGEGMQGGAVGAADTGDGRGTQRMGAFSSVGPLRQAGLPSLCSATCRRGSAAPSGHTECLLPAGAAPRGLPGGGSSGTAGPAVRYQLGAAPRAAHTHGDCRRPAGRSTRLQPSRWPPAAAGRKAGPAGRGARRDTNAVGLQGQEVQR